MPAVRNSRIKQIVEDAEDPSFQRYTMNGKETATFNLVLQEDGAAI